MIWLKGDAEGSERLGVESGICGDKFLDGAGDTSKCESSNT